MKTIAFKNTLLVLLLCIGDGVAQAQDNSKSAKDLYLSYFGNDSTSINISYVPCCGGDYALTLVGIIYNRDTIRIHDKLYFFSTPKSLDAIHNPTLHYLFPRVDTLFLREERETGRLYRYYKDYFGMGEAEKLLSDMSLEEGDRFVLESGCLYEQDVEVSLVEYNNGRKRIFLNGGSTIFREGNFPDEFPLWQEQFGINDIVECSASRRSTLLCEYKDGVQVYGFNNDCFQNVSDVEEMNDNQVSVYPNPTNYTITVSEKNLAQVEIVNIMGQTIISEKCDADEAKIDISSLASGVYMIKMRTKDGKEFSERIVKE